MSSRITIYNHYGLYLAEVDATFTREYKLNEFGAATFTLSTSDAKCREDYLNFGNFVVVEHEKLPVWSGMIDTPRIWNHGSVTSTVYSAEYILTCFITLKTLTIQGTFGSLFQQLIGQMSNNDIGNMIKIGTVYGGGSTVKRTYNYGILYDEIKKLCKDSGNDFELLPVIDNNGKLYFTANWYQKRGMLKNMVLYEDKNIKLSSTPIREQGRIGNRLRIYGNGASFDSRPTAFRNDETSIGKYGERWLAQAGQGGDLNANADALIVEYKTPRKTFDITVIDERDATKDQPYKEMRIGDQFPVSFHSVGFKGSGFGTTETIRILQMSYDESTNQLKLVADQVKV